MTIVRRVAAAAMFLGLGACSTPPQDSSVRSAAPPPDPDRASALFVSLDTFRADAAGSGGNPSARTPHLDRLARTGVQFEDGFAATPLTLPSHATMLTGLNPPAHGVRDNGTFRLDGSLPLLAETLRDAGFATGAFVTAFPLDRRFGLDRGFEVYDDSVRDRDDGHGMLMAQRPGREAADAAAAWWDGRPGEERWFAWVHLFDAHSPYDAPAALRAACGGDPYAADVALADAALGRSVREAVRSRAQLQVIVLGDHGEGLGDHDEQTHGVFIYGSTMRVPAVVWPAPAGERPGLRRAVFRMQDVGATLLPRLGLDANDAPGEGADVFAEDDRPAYLESRYALYHYGWAPLRGVVHEGWKYVEAPHPELYDLAADPGERRNLIDEHPYVADELAEHLDEIGAERGLEQSADLDPEARAALESLGYVTTDEEALPDAPDPKRMIRIQQMLEQAQARLSAGQPEGSLSLLRAALARNPDNKDVHQMLGLVHSAMGRHAEAVDSFRKCLSLPPHRNDRIPRFELASALLRLGRPGEAAEELETLVAGPDADASTWHNLGVARDRLGDREGARSAWGEALALDPGFELSQRALESAGGSR